MPVLALSLKGFHLGRQGQKVHTFSYKLMKERDTSRDTHGFARSPVV